MKRIISMICMALMVVSLCACSVGKGAGETTKTSEDKKTTVVTEKTKKTEESGTSKSTEKTDESDEKKETKEKIKGDGSSDTEFVSFMKGLPARVLKSEDTALNQLLTDREKEGFEKVVYQWEVPSMEEFEKSKAENEAIYKELTAFDKAHLSEKYQVMYDILEASFSDGKNDVDDDTAFYLSNNVLGEYQGVLSDLPTSMYYFEIRDKVDADSYINLIKTLDDYAKKLVEFEQERQDKGFGMCQQEIDNVIEQCDSTITADLSFLVEKFEENIRNCEALSDEEKESYVADGKNLIESEFVKAYTDVKEGLKNLNVKQKEFASVYDAKDGKDYFASLIESKAGFTDMDEYIQYLETNIAKLADEFEKAYKEAQKKYSKEKGSEESGNKKTEDSGKEDGTKTDESEEDDVLGRIPVSFSDYEDPNEVLSYLNKAMKDDFPAMRDLQFEMKILPEAMKKLMPGVAAFYIQSPADKNDAVEQMMLSGEYSPTSFTTIAHEGFPGHMYQFQYFKEREYPFIFNILSFSQYTEGYANYVQRYSEKYTKDPEIVHLSNLNESLEYFLLLRIECFINYEGASYEEVSEKLASMINGEPDSESVAMIIQQLTFSPAAFACYHGAGFRFDELKEAYKKKMGSDYTEVGFHEEILKRGAMPLSLLEEYLIGKPLYN